MHSSLEEGLANQYSSAFNWQALNRFKLHGSKKLALTNIPLIFLSASSAIKYTYMEWIVFSVWGK